MAGAHQHAAFACATSGKTWPGRTKSAAPLLPLASARTVLVRSSAEMPVVSAVAHVDRDRERGAERRIVCRHHRIEMQAPGLFRRQRRADDAGGMADDEGHLLRRAERGGDEQIALVLAVVVVGDDDDLAARKSGDAGFDAALMSVALFILLFPLGSFVGNGQAGVSPTWPR